MSPSIRRLSFLVLHVLCAADFAQALPVQEQPEISATPEESAVAEVVAESHPAQTEILQAVEAFRSGAVETALHMLLDTKKQHDDLPPGEVMFAHLCFAANQAQAGRQALEQAALNHPEDPEVWNMFADLAARSGRMAEADVLFQKALDTASHFSGDRHRQERQHINALAGLALICERRQQWDLAEQKLQLWIDQDPKNVAAWQRLAEVQLRLDKSELVLETLTTLRSFAPDQRPADVAVGFLYQKSGQLQQAAELLKNAATEHSNDVQTQLAVARWALTAGDTATLDSCIERISALQPGSVAVKALTAMSHRFAGKPAEAETIFRELQDEYPGSFDASNGLTLALLEQADPEKDRQAEKLGQVTARSYHDLRTAHGKAAASAYAWALSRLNRNQEAVKITKSVLNSGEISPEVGYIAADILKSAGERRLAVELLKAALASPVAFPQKATAQELFVQLQSAE